MAQLPITERQAVEPLKSSRERYTTRTTGTAIVANTVLSADFHIVKLILKYMINNKNKLTVIEWVDSYSVYEGWDFIKELAEPKVMKCLSVGWILKETDECILLMPHISGTNDAETAGAGMGGLSIPKVAITKRKELEYE